MNQENQNPMKTKMNQAENKTVVTQKVDLIDGIFTPSEAFDIVCGMIDEKVNFHKLQRLSLCEGNIKANTDFADNRIDELNQSKAEARQYIREMLKSGKLLQIEGEIRIQPVVLD